jgi:hypothetical protein
MEHVITTLDALISVSYRQTKKVKRFAAGLVGVPCRLRVGMAPARDAKRGSLDSHPLRKSHEPEVLGDSISAPILARLNSTT